MVTVSRLLCVLLLALPALGQRLSYRDYMDLGDVMMQRGEYRKAEDSYRNACILMGEREEPHAEARFALVHALFALGFYNYAANNLRLAVLDFDDPSELEVELESLFPDSRAFEDRLRSLDNYLEFNRSYDRDARAIKAYVLFKLGRTGEAQELFEQLEARDADDEVAMFFLRRLAPPALADIPELLPVLPESDLLGPARTAPVPSVGAAPRAHLRFEAIPSYTPERNFHALVR